jgi:two-component system cell cycle response regulator
MMQESSGDMQVLIVEDDPDQVMLYSAKFLIEGVLVAAVDNEFDAMRYLQGGGFDLVLLDVLLRGTNGIDILRNIKSDPRTSHIPVVMFTNYTKKEVRLQALELGAADFILKTDVTPKEMAMKIKDMVTKYRAEKTVAA